MLPEEQIILINDVLNNNDKVLDFNSISKINKTMSLLTFIIKEIIDFNLQKTNNGIVLIKFKKEKLKIIKMMQEKEKINDLLDKWSI